MSEHTAVFVHSPGLDGFAYPPECPFKSSRAAKTREIIVSMGLLGGPNRQEVAPAAASREDLEQFHSPAYLDVLQAAQDGRMGVEGLHMGLGTPDTPVFRGMYDYAALACGATLTAARLAAEVAARVAFNPSGGYHHAGPDHAAGFCYINDVALACLTLAAGGRRVLFLDVDVHHGDGVQNAFYDRSDVMTISFHESGRTLFPGTGFVDEIGRGAGRGYSVNVPLPVGTYDEAYLRAFRAVAVPLMAAYDPDVIVLELGLDGLAGDPLANLDLTNNAYAEVASMVMATGKPIAATGGGGYHPANTARGWALAWAVFCGEADHEAAGAGLGGVMLESTDWLGGLRDRAFPPDLARRSAVDAEIDATVEAVRAKVFPLHGL